MYMSFDPAIPILRIYPMWLILDVHKDLAIRIFVYNRRKIWNSCKWPPISDVDYKNKTNSTGIWILGSS